MYKVIVVDDEVLIRKRIIYGFDWNSLGYEVTDESDNGADALTIITGKELDLAIIDVAMPGMNGIELVKAIRAKNIPINVIFLTGHSNFEYAREALIEGVFYYILKPLNETEFIDALKKLSDKIAKESKSIQMIKTLTDKQINAEAVLECKFFSKLFHDSNNIEVNQKTIQQLRNFGVSIDKSYTVILCRLDKYLLENDTGINRIQPVVDTLKQCFGDRENAVVINDIYDNDIILLKEGKCQMENYVCTLQEALAENFVTQVLCGYSTEKSGVSGIVEGYKEAVSALNNTKILSKNNVGYALVYKMKRNQFALSSLQMKELQYNIEKCNYDVSESIIRNLFKEMLLKNVDYECIANNCNHLLRVITDIALVFGLDIKSFMNGFNDFEAAFIQMNNMDEIINWFVNITQGMIVSKLQVSSQNKNLLIVEKVREYILNNYQNIELSQTLIAEEMYVSPAYISGSFKKVVGMSMMQYITMIRLEKAKEILMLTDNDVRTTAIEVGYGDEYYFSRCFKKYFGYSPSTVKKQEDQNRQMKP